MKQILLSTSVLLVMSVNAQITNCTELFFSEYVEGSSQNKAIEVYNPTNTTIDLSTYTIERYRNGATNSSDGGVTTLQGMLASGDVFVITHGDTLGDPSNGSISIVLYNMGDMSEADGFYPTPLHMNGNDAMVLKKNGDILDVIGRVGEDPGTAWTDDAASGFTQGSWWTANHTLIRKRTVLYGDNNGVDLFNPSLEWDSLANDTWSNLGSHTCDCDGATAINEASEISYVMYPNPAKAGEVITVNTAATIESIDVINLLGEKVLTESENKIKTNKLAKGTYIIMINLNDGKVLENKIIIE